MRESQQVLEWINMGRTEGRAEGRAEGEANALLRLLAKRFAPGAPSDLAAKIRATSDLAKLESWFDLAYSSESLDAFRQSAAL